MFECPVVSKLGSLGVACMFFFGMLEGSSMCAAEPIDVATMSTEELIAALDTEYQSDASARYEAVSFRRFDKVTGEILRRREIESVPSLLRRANDDALVRLKEHNLAPWLAWYDTPVRVKYKVRFILERLLDRQDFNVLIGDPVADEVDIRAAIARFEKEKADIERRMRAKSVGVPEVRD